MVISKSQNRWRTRACIALVGALTFGLSAFADAQTAEPPKNSLVAVKLKPWPASASKFDRNALLAHPIYKTVGRIGKDSLGFEPLKFLDETFEGTFVAAVVAPDGKSAPSIAEYFDDMDARRDWARAISELETLKYGLVSNYSDNDEPYPASIDTYLEEYAYYSPSLPYGADYQYKMVEAGKGFELRVVFSKESRLSKLGKPPVLRSSGDTLHSSPTAPSVPLNLVVGAKIKDKAQLVQVLDERLGPNKNGFWSTKLDGRLELEVTVRGQWVVAADRVANMGGFLKSLDGTGPGWSKNPSFQIVSKNLDTNAPFVFFVDTPRILKSMKISASEQQLKATKLVGPLGYVAKPYTESQFRLDVFLGINAPQGSQLSKFLSDSGKVGQNRIETSNIPWDVSNAFALDYANCKALLDATVANFPELEDFYGTGQDVMAGMFGLDAEAGFDKLVSGNTVVSIERIDLFLNALESWFTLIGQFDKPYPDGAVAEAVPEDEAAEAVSEPITVVVPEETGEESIPVTISDDSPLDDGKAPQEESEPVVDDVEWFPAEKPTGTRSKPYSFLPGTVAAKVPIEGNRQAILKLLEPQMGDPTTTRTPQGLDMVTSEDGTLSYIIDGEWMYLSSGRTERLALYMLETAHGGKPSLSALNSWNRFTRGTKGRVLGYGHQKVDPAYSVVKGFLLFLGVEFRPLAEELGKLRDYHSVFSAVPDGLILSGEIVQGDAP